MKNSQKIALINDARLRKIAEYQVSRGFTRGFTRQVPTTQDKVTKAYKEMSDLFTEMKMLVKRGSFTISQLEDKVYKKFGITEDQSLTFTNLGFSPDSDLSDLSDLSDFIKKVDKFHKKQGDESNGS